MGSGMNRILLPGIGSPGVPRFGGGGGAPPQLPAPAQATLPPQAGGAAPPFTLPAWARQAPPPGFPGGAQKPGVGNGAPMPSPALPPQRPALPQPIMRTSNNPNMSDLINVLARRRPQ
jgi:hypothetical protein